jgi:hypothetical protein
MLSVLLFQLLVRANNSQSVAPVAKAGRRYGPFLTSPSRCNSLARSPNRLTQNSKTTDAYYAINVDDGKCGDAPLSLAVAPSE